MQKYSFSLFFLVTMAPPLACAVTASTRQHALSAETTQHAPTPSAYAFTVAAPEVTRSKNLKSTAPSDATPGPSGVGDVNNRARDRDLYVSTTGADTNPGTLNLPFHTIDRAARIASPGTTVHVAPGLYAGTVLTRSAGVSAMPVRYVSTVKWGARLKGQDKEAVWINHGDYTEIIGFDISGNGRIGILNLGSHTLIADNHVHHLAVEGGCTANGGAGIDNGNYASSNGDITGNIVHDIGAPGMCNGVHGIYSSNHGSRIINNIVYRVSSFGIHLWHAANRVTIANNTVFANGSATMGGGIVLGNGDGPEGTVLNHTQVFNNIVYDNRAASIKEFCYTGNECTGANNTFENNLVFNNGQSISLRHGHARNNITADPQFVDYRADGSGNYQLQRTSPAIGTGLWTVSAPVDFTASKSTGKRRVDLGANMTQLPFTKQNCFIPSPRPGA